MRKTVVGIVAALVIVGAVVVVIIRLTRGTPLPKGLEVIELRVMDVETGKPVKITAAQWQTMQPAPDTEEVFRTYRIDPATGHTICFIVTCVKCGKDIPQARCPKGKKMGQAKAEYRCPNCKQCPYPPDALL